MYNDFLALPLVRQWAKLSGNYASQIKFLRKMFFLYSQTWDKGTSLGSQEVSNLRSGTSML